MSRSRGTPADQLCEKPAGRPGERPFAGSGDEHLRTMAVLESAYLSAKTGIPEEPARILRLGAGNPKSEARNPKQIPMTKLEFKAGRRPAHRFGHWNLGFWICFGFRISCFGFPVSRLCAGTSV